MAENESAEQPSGAGDLVAAVVDPADTDAPPYAMFDLGRVDPAGAFLAGPLFFERGEEFTIDIRRTGSQPVRVKARVVAHERGTEPGMAVEFDGLSDDDREVLSSLADS
jgi:hypothetical protein